MQLSTVLLASLFTAASARVERFNQTVLSNEPGPDNHTSKCSLFELEDFFAEDNNPTRIEVRYSCDEEPIVFAEIMHKKEKHLLLWRGQGDSEDDVIDIHIAKKTGKSKISG